MPLPCEAGLVFEDFDSYYFIGSLLPTFGHLSVVQRVNIIKSTRERKLEKGIRQGNRKRALEKGNGILEKGEETVKGPGKWW